MRANGQLNTPGARVAIAVALVGALAAGCVGKEPVPAAPEVHKELATSNTGTLINEGGPVFALPGTVRLPKYYQGEVGALAIGAERLDGGAFTLLAAGAKPFALQALAPVDADGAFVLKGPITSQLFFATAEFTFDNATHRLRSLVRAEPGAPVLIDTASTLVAAKIALAAQRRRLDDMSQSEAAELTSQVRAAIGPRLEDVKLDQTNQALSLALDGIAAEHESLGGRLAAWEATLWPSSPTPRPTASAATPAPTPSVGDIDPK